MNTYICNFLAPTIRKALKEREALNATYEDIIEKKMEGTRVTRIKSMYDNADNLPVPAGEILSCEIVDLSNVEEKVWFKVNWDKGFEELNKLIWRSEELELE